MVALKLQPLHPCASHCFGARPRGIFCEERKGRRLVLYHRLAFDLSTQGSFIMALDLSSEIRETDMEQFCVEMMKRLDFQRRSGHLCDVTLKVGSGDDRASLEAHKIVLCAASPFFYNALNSDMKEKKEGVFRLKETSKAVMEEVLEYLYTGRVAINEQNAYDLMAAADYFLLSSLKALSSKVIKQTLSLSNCLMAYFFAMKYQCKKLQKAARRFIQSHFVSVSETEDFLNLSSKQVAEWISSDDIVVKGEEEVFEVVMRWIQRSEKRKKSFPDLFRHIRFIYVKRDFLFKVILSHPLVKDNLDCSNLVLDAMKLVFDGTDECYFAQPPRNCLKTHEDAIVVCGVGKTACYIPSEDTWYTLRRQPVPSAGRYISQALGSCHNKMYFVGGSVDGHPLVRYDPSSNAWTPITSFGRELKYPSVVTFRGALYVIGGKDEANKRLSTVQEYNPDTNLWQEVAPMSVARSSVCAVADRNSLYAIGGISSNGSIQQIVERFDPEGKEWSRIASTLHKRKSAGGAAVNQKVFVFGGLERDVPTTEFCEMYDPPVDTWSCITQSQTVSLNGGFTMAVSFKGKIYVCGESDDSKKILLQIYNADRNEWEFCIHVPILSKPCTVTSLRIPREVLDERSSEQAVFS